MKLKNVLFVFISVLFLTSVVFAQTAVEQKGLAAITEESVKSQLEFLSSDWTEGREAASQGIALAADYIASMFKVYGIKPAGDYTEVSRGYGRFAPPPERKRTYMQNFDLIVYEPGDDMYLKVHSKTGDVEKTVIFNYQTDFTINSRRLPDYAENFTAPVVFVGYGITDKENNYDDFANINVKGKIALRLAGYPGHRDKDSRAYEIFHPADRDEERALSNKKNEALMNSGALAVLDFDLNGNISRSMAVNKPFRWNLPIYEGDTPPPSGYTRRMRLVSQTFSPTVTVVDVTNRVADLLLIGSGIDIEQFEKNAAENLISDSRILADKKITIKTDVKTKVVSCQNVVGYIEGENPDEIIVLGGHYDHLGKDKGYIYNGADDDASGTVAVMTIAKAFIATGVKPKKSVVFAGWSAEEKGLLGSRYFVSDPFKPLENIVWNLNFDMIGRSYNDESGKSVNVTYTSHAVQLKEFLESYNRLIGLNLNLRGASQPRGGTDFTPFAEHNIPIMSFYTGSHPEYHQPDDEIELIDFNKMINIIKLGFLNAWKVANLDGKLVWDENAK